VAESYIVEILKDGLPAKPGELGEVVVTDLNNFCMPLIRYRVGDLAVAMDHSQRCRCGRGLPKIGKIEGRVQAIIFGTNGTYMPGTFFHHLFKDYDHIVRQYQIIQDQRGSLQLKVIKAQRYDQEVFDQILAKLHKFLGTALRIDVEYVDRIEQTRTGKHQGVVSRLPIDFQSIEETATALASGSDGATEGQQPSISEPRTSPEVSASQSGKDC
jgi:phenylacetate-CoA ligase